MRHIQTGVLVKVVEWPRSSNDGDTPIVSDETLPTWVSQVESQQQGKLRGGLTRVQLRRFDDAQSLYRLIILLLSINQRSYTNKHCQVYLSRIYISSARTDIAGINFHHSYFTSAVDLKSSLELSSLCNDI